MRFFILFFGLTLICVRGVSQNIENVDFVSFDDHIEVTYDLINCPLNTVFNLTLVFVKPNGETIYPKNVSGDLESVTPGFKKLIKWYFRNDVEDYNGEIKAILSIKGFSLKNELSPKVNLMDNTNSNSNLNGALDQIKQINKVGGGADNTILSMLLPGFGDHFVNTKEHTIPLLISAIYIGSVYTALNAKRISDENYAIYSNSRNQAEMDETFVIASNNLNKANIAIGVAAAVWLVDVIRVAAKGSKNDRLRNSGFGRTKLIPRYVPTSVSDIFELAFVKTF